MLKEKKGVPGKGTELGEKVPTLKMASLLVWPEQRGGVGGDIVGRELKITTANDME